MMNNVEEYLFQLKQALQGSDSATQQDALSDAEEYLRNALDGAREASPSLSEADALPKIVEEYGSPEEVAAAYREIERRQPTFLSPSRRSGSPSIFARFFGVVVDPRAWGALLYMLISLLTGILYFTWGVTGLSLSVGLIVLIIGLPFLALFLLSVRGIGLVEGRIVEALLGVRMPRRPIFIDRSKGWWERFKGLLSSGVTWKTFLYMLLMLPLGVIYFTLFVTFISVGLSLIAAPIIQLFFNYPIINWGTTQYYISLWALPLLAAAGFLVVVVAMHIAKGIGRLHGGFAKWMLVSE
jgi:uncharacterized membrane protein